MEAEVATANEELSGWLLLPDSLLLKVFGHLNSRDLIRASGVCRRWRKISQDNSLWCRRLLLDYEIDKAVVDRAAASPGEYHSDYLRLFAKSPCIFTFSYPSLLTEIVHVCIAHDGSILATCTADGMVRLWNTCPPFQLFSMAAVFRERGRYPTFYARFNTDSSMILAVALGLDEDGTARQSAEVYCIDGRRCLSLKSRLAMPARTMLVDWVDASHLLGTTFEVLGGPHEFPAILLKIHICDVVRPAAMIRIFGLLANTYWEHGNVHDVRVGRFVSPEAHLAAELAEISSSDLAGSHVDRQQLRLLMKDGCCTFCSVRRLNNIAPNKYRLCKCSTADSDRLLIFACSYYQIGFKVLHYSCVQELLRGCDKLIRQQQNRRSALHPGRRSDSPMGQPSATGDMEDQEVKLRQVILRTARSIQTADLVVNMDGSITDFRLSSDNRRLFVGVTTAANIRTVQYHVIDLETFKIIWRLDPAHSVQPAEVVADSNAWWLINNSHDTYFSLWDIKYGCSVARLQNLSLIRALVFHPRDPETVIGVLSCGMIKMWRSKCRIQEMRDARINL